MIIKIEKDFFNGLVQELDTTGYFGLRKGEAGRTDVFNFALALGLGNEPTPINVRNDFTRDEYMESHKFKYRALSKEVNGNSNPESMYSIIESYANTGFGLLAGYIKKYNNEMLLDKLTLEIDEMLPAIEAYARTIV